MSIPEQINYQTLNQTNLCYANIVNPLSQQLLTTKPVVGLQAQLKGLETYLKTIIFHQIDQLKDCH